MGRKYIGMLCLLLAVACSQDPAFEEMSDARSGVIRPSGGNRVVVEETRHVMIMVSAGFNSLSSYLRADLETLEQSPLTPKGRMNDQLVVFARVPQQSRDYSNPTAPVLYSLNKNSEGMVVRDTIKVWQTTDMICDTLVFREAMELVKSRFPAKSYGMVFSSHASGWLPDGYFNNPSEYERQHGGTGEDSGEGIFGIRRSPFREEFPPIPDYPAVKSIGQDEDAVRSREMDLAPFCRAIPMHLEYCLLDACLCGCIEVAYELKGIADIVGFSQTEVLAEGYNYQTLTSYLLKSEPDPVSVCRDFFDQYDQRSGINRSATVSVVDTRKLDPLAAVCKELFAKYRTQLATMSDSGVQRYFRYNRHYFYDLKDILVHAGMTASEQAALDQALEACLLYKAATPSFLGSFDLLHVCGFSMYLPSKGTQILDTFYKTHLAWNQATELIQ